MYRNVEARSRELCCCIEAISVIYSRLKITEVMSESIWLLPVLYPIVSEYLFFGGGACSH